MFHVFLCSLVLFIDFVMLWNQNSNILGSSRGYPVLWEVNSNFSIAYPYCDSLAQAVRARLPSLGSRVQVSVMWVSWWTKCSLDRFFSGFLPFAPTTDFIPPFLHTHLIHFVSFHFIRPCNGASGVVPASLLFADFNKGFHRISSLDTALSDKNCLYLFILIISWYMVIRLFPTSCNEVIFRINIAYIPNIYIQGVKKFRIQTLRVCRGDKMKPFCYVTNIWQVLSFLARGPWRVWRSMVLQKLLKMLGNYIIFIRDILPEMLENVPLQVR